MRLAQSIRFKNYDLPQVNESSKTAHLNFPKVKKMTKINCPKLAKVASNFRRFRKRKRETETETEKEKKD